MKDTMTEVTEQQQHVLTNHKNEDDHIPDPYQYANGHGEGGLKNSVVSEEDVNSRTTPDDSNSANQESPHSTDDAKQRLVVPLTNGHATEKNQHENGGVVNLAFDSQENFPNEETEDSTCVVNVSEDDGEDDSGQQEEVEDPQQLTTFKGKGKMLNNARDMEITIPEDALINYDTGRVRAKKKNSQKQRNSVQEEKIPMEQVDTGVIAMSDGTSKALEAQGLDCHAQNGHHVEHGEVNSATVPVSSPVTSEKLTQQSNGTGEYFIPVNTHKKFLRGEKLYLTKDNRKGCQGWKRFIICGLVIVIIAIAVVVGVLAAKPGMKSVYSEHGRQLPDQASISQESSFKTHSSPLFSKQPSTTPLTTQLLEITTREFRPTYGTTSRVTDVDFHTPSPNESSTFFVNVPNILMGEFTFPDVEFSEGLKDNTSNTHRSMVAKIQKELTKVFRNKGNQFQLVQILGFSPGSVIVKFLVIWNEDGKALSTAEATHLLRNYLQENNKSIAGLHVDSSSVKFTGSTISSPLSTVMTATEIKDELSTIKNVTETYASSPFVETTEQPEIDKSHNSETTTSLNNVPSQIDETSEHNTDKSVLSTLTDSILTVSSTNKPYEEKTSSTSKISVTENTHSEIFTIVFTDKPLTNVTPFTLPSISEERSSPEQTTSETTIETLISETPFIETKQINFATTESSESNFSISGMTTNSYASTLSDAQDSTEHSTSSRILENDNVSNKPSVISTFEDSTTTSIPTSSLIYPEVHTVPTTVETTSPREVDLTSSELPSFFTSSEPPFYTTTTTVVTEAPGSSNTLSEFSSPLSETTMKIETTKMKHEYIETSTNSVFKTDYNSVPSKSQEDIPTTTGATFTNYPVVSERNPQDIVPPLSETESSYSTSEILITSEPVSTTESEILNSLASNFSIKDSTSSPELLTLGPFSEVFINSEGNEDNSNSSKPAEFTDTLNPIKGSTPITNTMPTSTDITLKINNDSTTLSLDNGGSSSTHSKDGTDLIITTQYENNTGSLDNVENNVTQNQDVTPQLDLSSSEKDYSFDHTTEYSLPQTVTGKITEFMSSTEDQEKLNQTIIEESVFQNITESSTLKVTLDDPIATTTIKNTEVTITTPESHVPDIITSSEPFTSTYGTETLPFIEDFKNNSFMESSKENMNTTDAKNFLTEVSTIDKFDSTPSTTRTSYSSLGTTDLKYEDRNSTTSNFYFTSDDATTDSFNYTQNETTTDNLISTQNDAIDTSLSYNETTTYSLNEYDNETTTENFIYTDNSTEGFNEIITYSFSDGNNETTTTDSFTYSENNRSDSLNYTDKEITTELYTTVVHLDNDTITTDINYLYNDTANLTYFDMDNNTLPTNWNYLDNETITTTFAAVDNSTNFNPTQIDFNATDIMNGTESTNESGCDLTSDDFSCIRQEGEEAVCINKKFKCDGFSDCLYGYDESECESNCSVNFRCVNTTKCIKAEARCDGIWDCEEGSDEEGCIPTECGNSEVMCLDGSACIKPQNICNEKYNCYDKSDEVRCVDKPACESTNRFYCNDGLCIPLTLKCDGHSDCKDNEDEANCSCSKENFTCLSGECIDNSARCDGEIHCRDGSDEYGCVRIDINDVVQVCESGKWKLLCAENFTLSDANVICQELGFSAALSKHEIQVENVTSWMACNQTSYEIKDFSSFTGHFTSINTCGTHTAIAVKCRKEYSCGKLTNLLYRRKKRDVSDQSVLSSPWPFLAITYYNGTRTGCLSNIINSFWLVTSVECLFSLKENGQEQDLLVITRKMETSDHENKENMHRVQKLIIHKHSSNFRSNETVRDYDLALIKLRYPLIFENGTEPICLPREEVQPGVTCFAGGLADQRHRGGTSTAPSIASIAKIVMDRETCNQTQHYNGLISNRMLCTRESEAQSFCDHDVGAPLVCYSGTFRNWYLAGILTYQRFCGIYNRQPDIFSYLFAMRDFIEHFSGFKYINVTYDSNLYIIQAHTTSSSTLETTTPSAESILPGNMTDKETDTDNILTLNMTTFDSSVADNLTALNKTAFEYFFDEDNNSSIETADPSEVEESSSIFSGNHSIDVIQPTTPAISVVPTTTFDESSFDIENKSDMISTSTYYAEQDITSNSFNDTELGRLIQDLSHAEMTTDSYETHNEALISSTEVTSTELPIENETEMEFRTNGFTTFSSDNSSINVSQTDDLATIQTIQFVPKSNDEIHHSSHNPISETLQSTTQIVPNENSSASSQNLNYFITLTYSNQEDKLISTVPSVSTIMTVNATTETKLEKDMLTKPDEDEQNREVINTSMETEQDSTTLSDKMQQIDENITSTHFSVLKETVATTDIPLRTDGELSTMADFSLQIDETTTVLLPQSLQLISGNTTEISVPVSLSETTEESTTVSIFTSEATQNPSLHPVSDDSSNNHICKQDHSSCINNSETWNCSDIRHRCDFAMDCPDGHDEYGCVRLNNTSLLLEMKYQQHWLPVCSDSWKDSMADIICKQLGYIGILFTQYLPIPDSTVQNFFYFASTVNSTYQNIREGASVSEIPCSSGKVVALNCDNFVCGIWNLTRKNDPHSSHPLEVNDEHWPSVGVLRLTDSKEAQCIASIISSQWVLTSASCLSKKNSSLYPDMWEFMADAIKSNSSHSDSQYYAVKQIVMYPATKESQTLPSNDLAVVQLEDMLTFSDGHSAAICLSNNELETAQSCVTVGWTSSNSTGDTYFHYHAVSIVPVEECNSTQYYNGALPKEVVCIRLSDEITSVCTEDMGAPLMCLDSQSQKWEIHGVLISQKNCSETEYPLVYTSVSAISDWLQSVVDTSVITARQL